MKKLCTRLWSK